MHSLNMIILVAMTDDRIIGRQGELPWDIPEDLALFRRLTVGHTLVMGRKTFESIGRPLPQRTNIVISRSMPPMEGVIVCPDFSSAVERACQGGGKVYFIGGREIYRQALALVGSCPFPGSRKTTQVIAGFPLTDKAIG